MQIGRNDISWSYIGTIANTCINLALLPLILLFIPGDELGVWYVFVAINNFVVLLDFGFTATISRNVAYVWSGAKELSPEGIDDRKGNDAVDYHLLASVYSTCKLIYFVISAVALIAMGAAGTGYIHFISKSLDSTYTLIAWSVYALAVFLNLYYGYIVSFLRGVGALSQYYKALTISKIVQLLLASLLLAFGCSLIGVSIAYLVSCVVLRTLSIRYFSRYQNVLAQIKQRQRLITLSEKRELFRTMWHLAWRDGLVSISNYLSTQANTLICSVLLGLNETGSYGISIQMTTAICTVSAILYTTYQPKLQECAFRGDVEGATHYFSISIAFYWVCFILSSLIVAVVIIPVVHLVRPQFAVDISMFLAISLYFLLYRRQCIYASQISNSNTLPYVPAFLICSLLSIVLSAVLAAATPLGLWSLIVAPIVVNGAFNNWYWPMRVHRELGVGELSLVLKGVGIVRDKVFRRKNALLR